MSRDRSLVVSLGGLLLVLVTLLFLLLPERPGTSPGPAPATGDPARPTRDDEVEAALRVAPGDERPEEERETLQPDEASEPAPLPFRRDELYGTVLDAWSRRPVAAATVRVFPVRALDRPGATPSAVLETDADGRFRQEGLAAFELREALVSAEGYSLARARLTAGCAQEVLLVPGVGVAGRVLRRADRTPVEGVRVWLDLENQGLSALELGVVRTDAEGRFALDGVPARSTVSIDFAPDGSFPDFLRLSVGDDAIEGLELLLGPRAELRLRLVDLESGVPLPGLRGSIDRVGPFEADGAGVVTIGHDAERFYAVNGGVLVEIRAEDRCVTRILVPLEELEDLHDAPITRGATIEGRVRSASGQALGGAAVSVGIDDPFLGSPRSTSPGLPPGVTILSARPSSVRTDADGGFTLDRLFASGQVPDRRRPPTLHAFCEGWRNASLPIEIPPPGGKRWIEVILEPGAGVHGRVSRNGEPFRDAIVRAYAAGSKDAARACATNDGGEYKLEGLAAGETRLEVCRSEPPWSPLAEARVTLAAGEALEQDFSIDEARATIRGRVIDERGEPNAGAQVFVRRDGAYFVSPMGAIRGLGSESMRTAEDGSFELVAPAGATSAEVVAWRGGVESSVHVLPGASDVEVVLAATGKLRLSVTDPDGEDVRSIGCLLWWRSGASRETPSVGCATNVPPRADGSFELDLPTGRWDLELGVWGRAPAILNGVEITPERPRERSVTLSRGTTLEVRFESQGPPGGAEWLLLLSAEEKARQDGGDHAMYFYLRMHRRLRPGADGGLLASGLLAGTYVVEGAPRGWAVEPQRFEVPDGVERHGITLRWVRLEEAR